jgi:hypothetical protein
MRTFVFAVALSFAAACAHGQTGINVHAVRMDIKDSIASNPGEPGPRAIISMGKVTNDSAVVFTERSGQPRHEEHWVKGPSGWSLSEARPVDAAPTTASH